MANNYLINQLTIHLKLDIMLRCLNGGSKFLTKLIPITKLTSAFLFEQTELTVQAIRFVPADMKVIIRGSLNKFPDFFRMGTFIDSTHMNL